MSDSKKHAVHDTKRRLLQAACELFAEKGFSTTTNRDICRRADANVAAINYYFGGKESLYAEAWRKEFHDSLEKYPPDGGVTADASAEERLRGRIRAMVHKMADNDNRAFLIAHKEMAVPTKLLAEVKRECLQPLREEMKNLLRELLGAGASEKEIQFCQASIQAQCFAVLRHLRRPHRSRNTASTLTEHIVNDIEGYAEHVYRFSLAGIRAARELRCSEGNATKTSEAM